MKGRGVGARVWGSFTSSLRGLVGGSSSSSPKKVGKREGGGGEKWERCEELVKEVWEEGKEKREEKSEKDESVAREFNRLQYEKEGQLVECCCCYGEEPWEEMGACGEGHLVCR